MKSATEKLSNMASAAEENVGICKAKAEEKGAKATAATEEEKEIASDIRKAKEAKAKMEHHESKTEDAAEKLTAGVKHEPVLGDQPDRRDHGDKHHHGAAMPKTTVPAYPLGGYGTHKFPRGF